MVGVTRLFGAQAPHPKGPPTALPSLKLRLEHAVSPVLLISPNKKKTEQVRLLDGRGDMIIRLSPHPKGLSR